MSSKLTIQEHLVSLLPRLGHDDAVPVWPPDVFAICLSLLLKSGSYCSVLNDWPPPQKAAGEWVSWIRLIGADWRRRWVSQKAAPPKVLDLWSRIIDSRAHPVDEIGANIPLCQSLLELIVAADEASAALGLPVSGEEEEEEESHQRFREFAEDRLLPSENGQGSTLCSEIDPSRARVLPKMHTPQSGLTVRSFSLHLALCPAGEVVPEWVTVGFFTPRRSLNLLFVPWPARIEPAQFRKADPARGEMQNMADNSDFFTVDFPKSQEDVVDHVDGLFEAARAKMGRVDGLVLPEMALTADEHRKLSNFVLSRNAFLISGVGRESNGGTHGENKVCFDIPGVAPLEQSKHHRWRLDNSQVRQYGLGSQLYPEWDWWEHIALGNRRLLFVSFMPWLVMTVLICEDLARPDPVGDLVRAVGPNLVVALLMDGPQLKERWSGRYATTLADDPGCSVLSVTSLGMSNLSRPASGPNRSRVIGLWKDAKSGAATEIELPDGCGAVVLSLTARYLQEWTADGRGDGGWAGYPVLSGVHGVKRAEQRAAVAAAV